MKDKIKKISGAEIIVRTLIEENVDTIFGYPGGQVLHIYDELRKKRRHIRHILTAHEQGAAHAADGYARTTGKTGVVIATSGPGASNLVTGIATAYLDSVPMVAITGNVPTDQIGRDSFQELDIADITMPITKHNYIVKDVRDLHRILKEAFKIANEGRCGPVLVDIPKDIQIAKAEFSDILLPQKKHTSISEDELLAAEEIISNAERPFIYCGGGVVSADAGELLKELSERIDAPCGASLMGLSAIEHDFESMLGLTGMYGLAKATEAMKNADVIIAVGARFTDRATGARGEIVEKAKIVQLDIDPAEVDKNVRDAAYVIGDIRLSLTALLARIQPQKHQKWREEIDQLTCSDKPAYTDRLTPYYVIDKVSEYSRGLTVTTDVGQHQLWTAQRYKVSGKRSFLTSGGLGTMGFGMGAAIGASIAKGGERVVLFTGDGSFGMNLNELATAVSYNIPLVIIIMNNKSLGMVREWQNSLFGRESQTALSRKTDFPMLAKAFGADGVKVKTPDELDKALAYAFGKKDSLPFVIDCDIMADETVTNR